MDGGNEGGGMGVGEVEGVVFPGYAVLMIND